MEEEVLCLMCSLVAGMMAAAVDPVGRTAQEETETAREPVQRK